MAAPWSSTTWLVSWPQAMSLSSSIRQLLQLVREPLAVLTGGGLVWNTNTLATDGILRVQNSTVSRPTISSVTFDGTNVILGGTNGPINGSYSVLASTNVIAPLSNWVSIAVGAFDNSGHFSILIS